MLFEYLLVKLNVGGFKSLSDVIPEMILENGLAVALILFRLLAQDTPRALGEGVGAPSGRGRLSGQLVKRHLNVFAVADLFELDMGDLVVVDKGRVLLRYVSWQLREVGGHLKKLLNFNDILIIQI
jgi:hypothetical protein